jgi:hypothetical protein
LSKEKFLNLITLKTAGSKKRMNMAKANKWIASKEEKYPARLKQNIETSIINWALTIVSSLDVYLVLQGKRYCYGGI